MLDAVLAHIGKLHRQLAGAVTRQRGAVRGDVEEQVAPAVHAGLGPFLVVIRSDEDQLARVVLGRQLGAPLVSDALGTLELGAGRQQAGAIEFGPAVKLAGGQLDEIRLQLQAQLDDPLDVVDVVPVGDEVQHHGVTGCLDRPGHG
ncbi:hypothetical protein D3C84_756610 [compost metagenome]